MSNQFSYELDERQIRIMLQDGEVEYDQQAWSRFEQSVLPDHKPKSSSLSPKFNLSISRSVVVPVIFVVLIGGLSAILFSFVDFKKKDTPVVKNILEPTTKALPATTVSKPTATPVTKETPAITENKELPPPSATVVQPTAVEKTEKPVVATVPVKQPDVVVAKQPPVVAPVTDTKKTTTQPMLRKRKPKDTSEEIPTINTSSTILNQESKEPELDLK